ncbi:hypothetical protein LWM68_08065 [Niabella sp. W65]|nr:hypothetical protein [Niabella sp. W65]MCH7362722.1 hypothetical protein [Niabella sp. W65]
MKTIDEIYQSISNNILNVIDGTFKDALLYIEVIGEMVSFTGTFTTAGNVEKQIDVDEFDFELTFDLLELNAITTEGGSNKWNRAIFKLLSDGKFDVRVHLGS